MLIERSIPVDFKFAPSSDGAGDISGLAAVFNNVDATGDIIAPGAFLASLAKHAADETTPAFLWSHQLGEPIGKWTSLTESERGLESTGKLSDVPKGRDARTLAADGALGLSIGFRAVDFDYNDLGYRILRSIDLVEISVVAVPANSAAKITSIKSFTPRILEQTLRDAGCPKKLAASVISSGWRGATDDRREADDAAIQTIITSLAVASANLKGI